jgi:hypothetical protein
MAEGTMAWVENYCREHPLERYFDALEALTVTLHRQEMPLPADAPPPR